MQARSRFGMSGFTGWKVGGAAAAVLSLATPAVLASETPVMRVEEDWGLLLNDPDNNVKAPQFHTVMSPVDGLDVHYAVVLWNYRVDYGYEGDFAPGGVQLQAWDGEGRLARLDAGEDELSCSPEMITWTQRLSTNGVSLSFEICNGSSETWGAFGENMKITSEAAYENLNEYNTDVSTTNTCITYGSNRVDVLVLLTVRKYHEDGSVEVDNAPRFVYVGNEE